MDADEKRCPHCAETIKADALLCRYCHQDVSGAPGSSKAAKARGSRSKAIGCFAAIALGLLVFTCTQKLTEPGSTMASSPLGVDSQMKKIEDKVADDAVKQYNIAAGSGSATDRCAQAGMVAAAFLQAQDQQQYQTWKATEKADCASAGLNK